MTLGETYVEDENYKRPKDIYSIERKYGVEQGDDWLAVRLAAKFQPGQRVEFRQGKTAEIGTVIDIYRNWFFGSVQYTYAVQFDNKRLPRRTLEKWLSAI